MDARAQSRLETAALIAIVVVGTAVRLAFLFRPMQLDEAYTYNEYASKPVLDGLSWYTLPNNHLLNTLLIHVSTVVLGNEPWVVRLAALAAGLGLIPATYALTRRLCGPLRGASGGGPGRGVGALDRLFDERPRLHARRPGHRPPGRDGRADPRGRSGRAGLGLGLDSRSCRSWGALRSRSCSIPTGGSCSGWCWAHVDGGAGSPGRLRLDRLVLSGVVAALLTVVLYLPALIRMGLARVAANPYVAARPPGEVVRGLARTLGLAWLHWNSDIPRAVAAGFVLAWAASLVRLFLLAARLRRPHATAVDGPGLQRCGRTGAAGGPLRSGLAVRLAALPGLHRGGALGSHRAASPAGPAATRPGAAARDRARALRAARRIARSAGVGHLAPGRRDRRAAQTDPPPRRWRRGADSLRCALEVRVPPAADSGGVPVRLPAGPRPPAVRRGRSASRIKIWTESSRAARSRLPASRRPAWCVISATRCSTSSAGARCRNQASGPCQRPRSSFTMEAPW